MAFLLVPGIPEMAELVDRLSRGFQAGLLSGEDQKLAKRLFKTLTLLQENPRHNSLSSHEIAELSRRVGFKVFQSYLENRTPAAGRLFWAYGPGSQEITLLGLEPHPENAKRKGYDRVRLSRMPPE